MIRKTLLKDLYVKQEYSMQGIAKKLGYSVHKVQYWMHHHGIPRRSISDAVYLKHNPEGDPFEFRPPKTRDDLLLFGIGIGLYWGEGTKSNKTAVRLGNTDPELIKTFMKFMMRFFSVQKDDFRFGLQIFTDIDKEESLGFWTRKLKVKKSQFSKVIVTISGSIGTYRKKSEHGVVTLHYNNIKVRALLGRLMSVSSDLSTKAAVAQG